MKKYLVIAVVCIIMCAILMPVTVFAADADSTEAATETITESNSGENEVLVEEPAVPIIDDRILYIIISLIAAAVIIAAYYIWKSKA